MIGYRKVHVRKTHPALYRSIMLLALMSVALAVNFWSSNPTFTPYRIPKNLAGAMFFGLGVAQIAGVHVLRDLRMVRIVLAASGAVMLFWAIVNTQQFFAGNASLQLPILYVGAASWQFTMLLEAPVNPVTERK